MEYFYRLPNEIHILSPSVCVCVFVYFSNECLLFQLLQLVVVVRARNCANVVFIILCIFVVKICSIRYFFCMSVNRV